MKNDIYKALIPAPEHEGHPSFLLHVWLTEEVNGYALIQMCRVDNDAGEPEVIWFQFDPSMRDHAIERAVAYVIEQKEKMAKT